MARSPIWVAALLVPGAAFAGPPYITDDPEPTDLRHWEIYAFSAGSRAGSSFDGVAGVDLNYGALPGVQLTVTLPFEYSSASGTRTAFGDLEIGVKYRFIDRETKGFQAAIFPRVILPTAARGTHRPVAVLLPVWAQQKFGAWSVFGGGGYAINPGTGNRDFVQAGLAATRAVTKRLSAGVEVAYRGAENVEARDYAALNFGASWRLGGPFALLVSGGPGVLHARDGGRFNAYAALAIDF